jgi:hypothetical protein
MAPHHGEVPMTYMSRRQKTDPAGLSAELSLRIPRLVIEDIAALVMQLAIDK